MADIYEPWENNWTPEETEHLEHMTGRMTEPTPLAEACIIAELEIPALHLGFALETLRQAAQTAATKEQQAFFHELGAAISIEYLESEIEWCEPFADLAQWFLPENEI